MEALHSLLASAFPFGNATDPWILAPVAGMFLAFLGLALFAIGTAIAEGIKRGRRS